MATDNSTALYNSRIFQTYLDYLADSHADIDPEIILEKAGIPPDEVADTDHWFSQSQADRFYEVIVAETGDEQIARKAGRYGASSKALNLMKLYVLGIIAVDTIFKAVAKIFPLFTRGASVSVKRLGPGKIELISKPSLGVHERPYQCENRYGFIEAIPKLFTNVFATVEHPQCLHKSDGFCRYIVSWTNPLSLRIKLWRNFIVLGGALLCMGLFFLLPMPSLAVVASVLVLLALILSIASMHYKGRELENIIESYHHMTEEQLSATRIQYDNALLVQEIGQATAAMLNVDDLMHQLVDLLSNRLNFDRGLIMLADESGAQLVFSAGYGYSEHELSNIQNAVFHLDNPDSKGIFVRCFLDQKPIKVNNISEIKNTSSSRSQKLAHDFNVHALLCVPIVFEKTSLGILAVDNVVSKAPLKKNDVNLLQGVAAHLAIGINNARLFRKLQDSEEKYRQTLESITEGYFETDLSHRVVFMNNTLGTLLGQASQEIIGSRLDRCFAESARGEYALLMDNIRKSGEPVRFAQFDVIHKDGTILTTDLSASLKMDADGQASGYRGILRDATERLELEKERKQLQEQLLQAQKMEAIGTLAGGIAHDFNNLMMGIQGRASLMMLSLEPSHPQLEHLHSIEEYIRSATHLTNQLLGITRGGKYEPKPVELNDLIKQSSAMFGRTKKEMQIRVNSSQPRVVIEGDRRQLEQVLLNLYVNAWQAKPEDRMVSLEIGVETLDAASEPCLVEPGFYAKVSITDNGVGMDEDICKRIFDPFFTTKEKGRGTGLGLASAYGIVKNHGGIITVSSKVGQGTTFNIYLPLSDGEALPEPVSEGKLMKGSGAILLVDDEEMIIDIGQAMIEELGYQAYACKSGEQAVQFVSERGDEIDLVILDLIMPGMAGNTAFELIRQLQPGMPVLLCSGYAIDGQAEELLKRGCNGFIQKPFNLAELSLQIRKVLDTAVRNQKTCR